MEEQKKASQPIDEASLKKMIYPNYTVERSASGNQKDTNIYLKKDGVWTTCMHASNFFTEPPKTIPCGTWCHLFGIKMQSVPKKQPDETIKQEATGKVLAHIGCGGGNVAHVLSGLELKKNDTKQ